MNFLKPYDLLENVLLKIENGIKEGVSAENLADYFSLSQGHLRRLFNFAFKQSLSGYIRSRRLSESLEELLKNDTSVLDIALTYGFEYEQTFIRSFKQKFGITPGDFRKNGKIIKVTPPIRLFDKNKMPEGALFGPDIVIVPEFYTIGKLHRIPHAESTKMAQEAAIEFWNNERLKNEHLLKDIIAEPNVYFGITRNDDFANGISEYLPSVKVKNLKTVPEGLCGEIFESALCVNFRYIGKHHYYDINAERARSMYCAVEDFIKNDSSMYKLKYGRVNFFEKIDTKLYDGTYCQMEWYAPIEEKSR